MDELDRLIIQALQVDGRTPFTHIARHADVSETTIRTRYQRLVGQGIVRPVGFIDPSVLGYQATAMVAVSTEPGMAGAIARIIAPMPEVRYLVTTLGSYDLILEVICQDLSHLTDVVTRQIQQIAGVRATETLLIAESHKLACDWSPWPESRARA